MLKAPPAVRGISLVELLVSLVIASLGLLTLVALQAASLRYAQVSQRRAEVTLLAEDLLERLRVNTADSNDLKSYEYSDSFSAQASSPPGVPQVLCDNPAVQCTVAQMAAFDLYHWRQRVRTQLPKGAVLTRLTPVAAPAGAASSPVLDLWIAWRDPVQHQAAGAGGVARPAGECPSELALDSQLDVTVRCLAWRVRR